MGVNLGLLPRRKGRVLGRKILSLRRKNLKHRENLILRSFLICTLLQTLSG
jgi:hypothetical protein